MPYLPLGSFAFSVMRVLGAIHPLGIQIVGVGCRQGELCVGVSE